VLFKDDAGCMLDFNKYHEVADALGGRGLVVSKVEDLQRTFEEAKNLSRGPEGKPVLINALIGKTDFRKGSISI